VVAIEVSFLTPTSFGAPLSGTKYKDCWFPMRSGFHPGVLSRLSLLLIFSSYSPTFRPPTEFTLLVRANLRRAYQAPCLFAPQSISPPPEPLPPPRSPLDSLLDPRATHGPQDPFTPLQCHLFPCPPVSRQDGRTSFLLLIFFLFPSFSI